MSKEVKEEKEILSSRFFNLNIPVNLIFVNQRTQGTEENQKNGLLSEYREARGKYELSSLKNESRSDSLHKCQDEKFIHVFDASRSFKVLFSINSKDNVEGNEEAQNQNLCNILDDVCSVNYT